MSSDNTPLMEISESIRIEAPPAAVWSLVTAMDRYGEWSSENTGGYWRKGADGEPGTGQVGDMFVGVNRRGDMEWKAPVEIIERDEERAYAFVTGGLAGNYALWRYELQPDGDATILTETWHLRTKTPNMETQADMDARADSNRESISATLKGMKATAEAGA